MEKFFEEVEARQSWADNARARLEEEQEGGRRSLADSMRARLEEEQGVGRRTAERHASAT